MEIPAAEHHRAEPWRSIFPPVFFLCALYLFLASIDLMSVAFKLAGKEFAEHLLHTTSDPLAALLIGFLSTAIVQSSSSTTSIAVGLVAAGTLPLRLAVPIIMGANIGTTVTNTIVSIGHVTRRGEFRRAFAAATVHDFFNILAVLVIFPIEMLWHPVERTALFLEKIFEGFGGIHMVSPLKAVVRPVTEGLAGVFPHTILLLIIALIALFFSLSQMVRIMRGFVFARVEGFFDRVLFRNDAAGFLLGWLLTATVQSSSATTSLVVPLAGTGVLSLRKIFPYTLGANLGTTITAILASFATGNPVAITVAFSHMVFNIMGMLIFYPGKAVPLWMARKAGDLASRSGRSAIIIIVFYACLVLVPLFYVIARVRSGG
ncbi:MAG: Na/Pi symporter [Candidatus Eisenbacteria bacterium]|nr:Na/Pi symporter [Candidatus Eisenbacteria bacterium]